MKSTTSRAQLVTDKDEIAVEKQTTHEDVKKPERGMKIRSAVRAGAVFGTDIPGDC